jgi:polyisoprenoid-binding protein YceI
MAWQVDLAHTQVAFAVRHLGISLIRGNMQVAGATLDLNEARPEESKLSVRMDVSSLDTRDANRDGHLKSGDFFDVANHPFITFATSKVVDRGNGACEVAGDLTIRGVTREVTLRGEYSGPVLDPISGKRKVGFLLNGDVVKNDFGITWNVPMELNAFMLADRVAVTIDAQAIETES